MKDTKDTKEKGKSVPLQIGKVTAPEYIIPLGPFHPALLEGEYFKLKVEGERVLEADLKLGYNYRGIMKLAETRSYWQNRFDQYQRGGFIRHLYVCDCIMLCSFGGICSTCGQDSRGAKESPNYSYRQDKRSRSGRKGTRRRSCRPCRHDTGTRCGSRGHQQGHCGATRRYS